MSRRGHGVHPITTTFIEPGWQDSLVALLVAINGLAGAPERTALLRPLVESDVAVLAQAMEQRTYRPEQWFGAGAAGRPRVAPDTPPVKAELTYAVVALAAEPSGRQTISSRAGGLLYEDPFYAVLAGFNIGTGLTDGYGWSIEVSPVNREQAWARRQGIVDALRQGSYAGKAHFASSGPLQPAQTELMRWRVDRVSGTALSSLFLIGRGSISLRGEAPQLYALYRFVAP